MVCNIVLGLEVELCDISSSHSTYAMIMSYDACVNNIYYFLVTYSVSILFAKEACSSSKLVPLI